LAGPIFEITWIGNVLPGNLTTVFFRLLEGFAERR
jgi:hypothetical protein